MRYIIYSLVFVLGILSLQSCLKEEKNIFGDSSAERLIKATKEYDAILNAAENGWVVDYFAESEENKMGGYQMLCKFDKGMVTMAGAYTISNRHNSYKEMGKQIKSTYRFLTSQGPVLSFDSYNPVLHIFSDPGAEGSNDADGYAGDFEFVVVSASSEYIELRGLKHHLKIVMRPMEVNKDWQEYCEEVVKTREEIEQFTRFEVSKAGQRLMYVTFWSSDNEIHNTEVEGDVPVEKYTVTNKGLNLYRPLNFGGTEVEYLNWDAEAEKFVDANESSGIQLKPVSIDMEQVYGTYAVTADNLENSPIMVTFSKGENGNVRVSDELFGYEFDIEVYGNNKFGIKGQDLKHDPVTGRYTRLGVASVTDILWSKSSAYNYKQPYQGSWYRGSEEKPQFKFIRSSFQGFIFVTYLIGVQVVVYKSDSYDEKQIENRETLLISNITFQKQ